MKLIYSQVIAEIMAYLEYLLIRSKKSYFTTMLIAIEILYFANTYPNEQSNILSLLAITIIFELSVANINFKMYGFQYERKIIYSLSIIIFYVSVIMQIILCGLYWYRYELSIAIMFFLLHAVVEAVGFIMMALIVSLSPNIHIYYTKYRLKMEKLQDSNIDIL